LKDVTDSGAIVPMLTRRLVLAAAMVVMVTCSVHVTLLNAQAASGRSGGLDFSSGPNSNQIISGTYTIRTTNVANMDSIAVELWESSAWVSIATISGAPWLTAWDTSSHSDGNYKLRIQGTYDNASTTNWVESPTFTLDNTAPSNLNFEISNALMGDGSSTINRAWFTTSESGSLTFNWTATDAHLSHATLTNVPGSGNPSQDGPGTILNEWNWSPGDFSEGTWSPLLTVFDEGGASAQSTIHIGIDRTGPSVGNPSLSETAGDWTSSTTLQFSGLGGGASDNGGSGISTYHARDSANEWGDIGSDGSGMLALEEGIRTIQFRAIDKVDNVGNPLDVSIKVDRTAPVAGGWVIPELTDSMYGQIPVAVDATDQHSGIDITLSSLEYGFDTDGSGSIPDITSSWLDIGTGTSGSLSAAIDWSTRAGQYLSLRAVLTDIAGNTITTQASHFQILPGLDFTISDPSLNRLIVRAGQNDPVLVQATIETSQAYTGSVIVEIQSAPADRNSVTEWTTLETITTASGELIDKEQLISAELSMIAAGEYDLRLIIDPGNNIDENDEGNNEVFLMISAADPTVIGTVSGFAPNILLILLAGVFASHILQRRESAS
jgi:hypothetical protein